MGRETRGSLSALLPHGRLGGQSRLPGALPAERGRARGGGGSSGGGPARRKVAAAAVPALLTWAASPAPLPSAPWRMNGPGKKVRESREGQGLAGRLQGLPPAPGCSKLGHDGVEC